MTDSSVFERISVYLNPQASRTDKKSWEDLLRYYLFRYDMSFFYPKDSAEFSRLLQADVDAKTPVVFCVGGDGTAHLAIQKLAGTATALLMIPAGTANDLACHLGLSANIKRLVRIFQMRTFCEIDLIEVLLPQRHLMATNGGIGIAAAVAAQVNNLRKNKMWFKKIMGKIGDHSYTLLLAKMLFSTKMLRYRIEIQGDGFQEECEVVALFVNNQPVLGGHFLIAPYTKNNDGRFNVTLFTHKNRLQFINACIDFLRNKTPENDCHFRSFETTQLHIRNCDVKPLAFFGDGDVLGKSSSMTFRIAPEKMKMFRLESPDLFRYDSYDLSSVDAL